MIASMAEYSVKTYAQDMLKKSDSSEELKQLSEVVRVIKAHITQFNKFHANAMFQHVYEAGDSTIDSLSLMESDNGKSGRFSNFVFWQQIRPAFAFERFGKGGAAIYDGLRRGQAQLAFNTHKIVEFTEKTYTTKEVNSWEKEVKEIKLGNDIVKMRVSEPRDVWSPTEIFSIPLKLLLCPTRTFLPHDSKVLLISGSTKVR